MDLSKAIDRHPTILSLCVDRNVMPTVAYLRSIGMTKLGRVLTLQPSILSLSVTANLVRAPTPTPRPPPPSPKRSPRFGQSPLHLGSRPCQCQCWCQCHLLHTPST